MHPRAGVPACVERRLERQAMMGDTDRGDPVPRTGRGLLRQRVHGDEAMGRALGFHTPQGPPSREFGYGHRKKAWKWAAPRQPRTASMIGSGGSYGQKDDRSTLAAAECLARF